MLKKLVILSASLFVLNQTVLASTPPAQCPSAQSIISAFTSNAAIYADHCNKADSGNDCDETLYSVFSDFSKFDTNSTWVAGTNEVHAASSEEAITKAKNAISTLKDLAIYGENKTMSPAKGFGGVWTCAYIMTVDGISSLAFAVNVDDSINSNMKSAYKARRITFK